jgi:hypothetical protein
MLRTNLSTRPFYNVRAVRFVLGVLIFAVLAISVGNVARAVSLSMTQRTLGARAQQAEREAARLRAEATTLRARVNPTELGVVATAAREANGIIDQRAFSWTGLFSQFEATLPADVRITAVQPQLESDGTFTVSVGVQARRVEDLDAFLEALETQSTFRDVLSVQEQTVDDDLIEAQVVGVYVATDRDVQPREAGR